MQNLNLSLTRFKQIFHAYFPLVFIILFPKSFLGIVFATGYVVFSGYIYLERINKQYPEYFYEYYLANSILTLVIIGLHVNAL